MVTCPRRDAFFSPNLRLHSTLDIPWPRLHSFLSCRFSAQVASDCRPASQRNLEANPLEIPALPVIVVYYCASPAFLEFAHLHSITYS